MTPTAASPQLILFKNGMAVWRESGVHPAEQLIAKIREHQYTKSDEE